MSDSPFRGLYTVIYRVPDLAAAKDWYVRMFGVQPYFDEPFYVGFEIAGCELGLLPGSDRRGPGPGGVVASWGVDDARAAQSRLLELGASPYEDVSDVGGEILIGSVQDPFGNVLGVIQNPHFHR